jgi:Conjugal transfer protein TraD
MTHRVEASQRRTDTRQWVVDRRERTRQLIELGGLVQKAGLVELTEDDRAVLLGAFLAVADKLQAGEREQAITLWRRSGKRAFADDNQNSSS